MSESSEAYKARLDALFAPVQNEISRLRAELAAQQEAHEATPDDTTEPLP